jgi:transcriptional regulator with XRE-family HTH domain
MAKRLPIRPVTTGGKSRQKLKQTNDIGIPTVQVTRGPRKATKAGRNTLGWRIHHLRIQMGLTQRALAEELGVVQATVSAWERSVVAPEKIPLRSLRQLCNALDTTPSYLLHGKDSGRTVAERLHDVPTRVTLPPSPKGSTVLRVERKGLASEALSLRQAQAELKQAVAEGRPVWLVLG